MTNELDLGPELGPELLAALRAEAYRPPVVLTAAQLSARLATERRQVPRPWLVAAAATLSLALVAAVVSFLPIGGGPGRDRPTPSSGIACEVSKAVRHGSWWVEIGGPNAFFNIEPGTLWANADGSRWLVHTRFAPDATAGEPVSIRAEHVASLLRVDGVLNGRAVPANIFNGSEPAPALPGGWYLFEQGLPIAGCWRLVASIGDRVAGEATIEVGPPRAGETSAPSMVIPTPNIAPGEITERYPDGLPKRLGETPVLRGVEARDFATSRSDASPFLVSGWVTYQPGVRFCAMQPAGEAWPWTRDCARAQFADQAGSLDAELSDAITFRYVLDQVHTGPLVAVVHLRDPRASTCGAAEAVCSGMMVVERIVWEGDAATAPGPLGAEDLENVLAAAQGSADVVPLGDGAIKDCGELLPAAAAYLVDSGLQLVPGVTLVELEPTGEALQRAKAQAPGVDAALSPGAVECTSTTQTPHSASSVAYRWLVLENAALLVRTHVEPTAADRDFLERLEALLTEAASGG